MSAHTSVNCKACNSDDSFKDGSNIFAAVKSGILMSVQSIVEIQGPGAFNTFDEKGNTPAHWACLHGNKLILNYIIECEGFINEPSQNDIGQRPIHWACYEGHLHIVEILLQQGVSIDIQDKKGKTPLIAAAQNGRCSVGAFLISKGASKVFVDCDGDGPLHWAAYNGQVPMVRMLVYFGYDPEQPDGHQQTPVHLACLRGSVDVVRDLCEIDKVDITVRDKNGCTPYMLALKKKQYNACNYLKQVEQRRTKKIYFPRNFKSLIDGSFVGGSGLNMYKFLVLFLLFFAYPLYVYEIFMPFWNELFLLQLMFLSTNVAFWITFVQTNKCDPGFLPQNTSEYTWTMQNIRRPPLRTNFVPNFFQITFQTEAGDASKALNSLCHSCRIVKPQRSKHCRYCNRCVEVMDHHCYYVNNCVGLKNRAWFFFFTLTTLVLGFISLSFCGYLFLIGHADYFIWFGTFMLSLLTSVSALAFVCTIINLTSGMTTNERANWARYSYLIDSRGRLMNPFNKGFFRNVAEYFNVSNYDEVARNFIEVKKLQIV